MTDQLRTLKNLLRPPMKFNREVHIVPNPNKNSVEKGGSIFGNKQVNKTEGLKKVEVDEILENKGEVNSIEKEPPKDDENSVHKEFDV